MFETSSITLKFLYHKRIVSFDVFFNKKPTKSILYDFRNTRSEWVKTCCYHFMKTPKKHFKFFNHFHLQIHP